MSKAGGGIVSAPVPALAELGEGEGVGEARSKVAVATKTTRQKDSSKLLKHFPLHCRKKSSALDCRHSSETGKRGRGETRNAIGPQQQATASALMFGFKEAVCTGTQDTAGELDQPLSPYSIGVGDGKMVYLELRQGPTTCYAQRTCRSKKLHL